MDDLSWAILAAVAIGAVCGGGFIAIWLMPYRTDALRSREFAEQRQEMCETAHRHLVAKRAESARYASALARITTRLASAAPQAGEPFYPHRKIAFDKAVGAVMDACREDL